MTVADYGIRGLHLAHELLDGYDVLVLVDAVPAGEAPGTVSLMEVDTAPEAAPDADDGPGLDAHSMNPEVVLASLSRLGGSIDRVLVVGCEPRSCEPTMGLSDEVDAAVDLGVAMVDRVLADLLNPTERSEDTP